MKKFRLKLTHDKGQVVMVVQAKDLESAKRMVMKAENCPERAITPIKL